MLRCKYSVISRSFATAIISFALMSCVPQGVKLSGDINDIGVPGVTPPLPWEYLVSSEGRPEIPRLPQPSAVHVVNVMTDTNYCGLSAPLCGSLRDLSAEVGKSINAAGFPAFSYFFGYQDHVDLEPKVIILTGVERITPSGRPASIDRFGQSHRFGLREWSWAEILRTLFDGREGRLRLYVIEIGGAEHVGFASSSVPFEDMKNFLGIGSIDLPNFLDRYAVDSDTFVRFMVYEYNAQRGLVPEQVDGARTASVDLAYSGIHLADFPDPIQ